MKNVYNKYDVENILEIMNYVRQLLRFYNVTVWNLLTYFMQKPNVLLYARLRVKQFINARIKRISMGQSSSNQQTEKLP